jgi:hypothetical protein
MGRNPEFADQVLSASDPAQLLDLPAAAVAGETKLLLGAAGNEISDGINAVAEDANAAAAAVNLGAVAAPGAQVTINGINATELAGRLTPTEMASLQAANDTEFAQIYLTGPGKNGGGGTYYLLQGDARSVQIPIGPNVRLINHTHPEMLNGNIVPLTFSEADQNVLRLLQEAGSPQRTSQIVPEVGQPFNFRR